MLTDIEWMLASIRRFGSTPSFVGLREGPRPETERALGAAFQRVIFTCSYCGGHCRGECDPECSVKKLEQGSSSRSDDR